MRASCAVIVRDVRQSIAGWIIWHLALGFDRILVFDTGSTDGTREIVQALEHIAPVELRSATHWQGPADVRRLMITREAIAACEDENWFLILDADEYLDPGLSLAALLERAPPEASAIALNWCIFGSAVRSQTSCFHPVARHDRRAPESFPDHGFVRLIVRPDHLGTVADPIYYGLDRWRIFNPSGQPVHWNGQAAPVNWDHGRILHYVCAEPEHTARMPEALWQHFDRNDTPDTAPERHLSAYGDLNSHIAEQLLLRAGQAFALAYAGLPPVQRLPERDSHIPERRSTPSLRYHRIEPTEEQRLLLSPPCRIDEATPRPCLLKGANGNFVTISPDRTLTRRPEQALKGIPLVVALIYPDGPAILTATDSGPIATGDIPCISGQTSLRTQQDKASRTIRFPLQSALGEEAFMAVSVKLPQPAPAVPIPGTDMADGLSLRGLYLWASRRERSAQEVQRTLCLLSPQASAQIQDLHPELDAFLNQSFHASTTLPDEQN